jgi:hypothetical protein
MTLFPVRLPLKNIGASAISLVGQGLRGEERNHNHVRNPGKKMFLVGAFTSFEQFFDSNL